MKEKTIDKRVIDLRSLSTIDGLIDYYQASKILLVTGKQSFELCGAKDIIKKQLKSAELFIFNNFSVNPKIEDAVSGAQLAIDNTVDLILAIGGGSVLDMAKLIKAFMSSPRDAELIVRGSKSVQSNSIPLIAVPTTAGSGSEATHFAVVYIYKDKFSLASPYLLPDTVILDARLLKSASAYQKAINGLDALAQAIEGCWAVNSTAESRALSLTAIELLIKHLPRAIKNNDIADLQNIHYAAHLAGQVINITKTTAPHAFSYAFTSYHGVPHGHAVWLTLPAIFELHCRAKSSAITDSRGDQHFNAVMKSLVNVLNIDPYHPKEALHQFMESIDVEPSMQVMGAKTKNQRAFAANQVNTERLSNNPVSINHQQIASIFSL